MAFFYPVLTNAVLKSPFKKGGKILAFIEAFPLKEMPY
jgi:hypothetical protein